jgi:hypothetical protein
VFALATPNTEISAEKDGWDNELRSFEDLIYYAPKVIDLITDSFDEVSKSY